MANLPNKHGGGSKTNINGLHFEQTTSLNDALINKGYTIKNDSDVYQNNKKIGISAPKHKLYNNIL